MFISSGSSSYSTDSILRSGPIHRAAVKPEAAHQHSCVVLRRTKTRLAHNQEVFARTPAEESLSTCQWQDWSQPHSKASLFLLLTSSGKHHSWAPPTFATPDTRATPLTTTHCWEGIWFICSESVRMITNFRKWFIIPVFWTVGSEGVPQRGGVWWGLDGLGVGGNAVPGDLDLDDRHYWPTEQQI